MIAHGVLMGPKFQLKKLRSKIMQLRAFSPDESEVIGTQYIYRLAELFGSSDRFCDVIPLPELPINKFLYSPPRLHRQHQRLAACGVRLVRTKLTNYGYREER